MWIIIPGQRPDEQETLTHHDLTAARRPLRQEMHKETGGWSERKMELLFGFIFMAFQWCYLQSIPLIIDGSYREGITHKTSFWLTCWGLVSESTRIRVRGRRIVWSLSWFKASEVFAVSRWRKPQVLFDPQKQPGEEIEERSWSTTNRFITSPKSGETHLVVLVQMNADKKSNKWLVSTFSCKTSNFLGLLDVQGRTNSNWFYPSFLLSCDFSDSLGIKTTVTLREWKFLTYAHKDWYKWCKDQLTLVSLEQNTIRMTAWKPQLLRHCCWPADAEMLKCLKRPLMAERGSGKDVVEISAGNRSSGKLIFKWISRHAAQLERGGLGGKGRGGIPPPGLLQERLMPAAAEAGASPKDVLCK